MAEKNEAEPMIPVAEIYRATGSPNDFVDIQIATAKRYPRDMAQVRRRIQNALTPEVASRCHYHLPARKNQDGGTSSGPISGGNIRLAEIAAQSWGNCRVQVLDSGEENGFAIVTCRVIDLESNFAAEIPAKRRLKDKTGKRYSDDMVASTTNAAYAIAYRNGVRKLLGPYWEWMCDEARNAARADVDKNLAKRRKDALDFFAWRGIPLESILKKVNRTKTDDVTGDDVMTLLGYVNAVESGEATIAEIFEVEFQVATPKPDSFKGDGTKQAAAQSKSKGAGEGFAPAAVVENAAEPSNRP